jgi:hypothetical protein
MKRHSTLFLLVVFLCPPLPSWGQVGSVGSANPENLAAIHSDSIQGLGYLNLQHKKMDLASHVAIKIIQEEYLISGINEWGGEVFRFTFSNDQVMLTQTGQSKTFKHKKLFKAFKLPFTAQEFKKLLLGIVPQDFSRKSSDGELTVYGGQKKFKNSELTVTNDRLNSGDFSVPKEWIFRFKKGSLKLTWLSIK